MNFPCSAALLLLLGALGAKCDSNPARQKVWDWTNLRLKIQNTAIRTEGVDCDVSPEQTHAFFLLVDLIVFHPNSVLEWAWPRYQFYTDQFTKLATDKRFCTYDPYLEFPKMVCHVDKCAKCEGLDDAADILLKKACAYNGNGGKDAPTAPKEGGSIGEPEVWTPSDEECQSGWLTKELARQLDNNLPHVTPSLYESEPCEYFPKVAVAYAYIRKLISSFPSIDPKREIDEKREFWEDKLRALKDGKGDSLLLCYPETVEVNKTEKGPFVCGKDALCIDCKHVTKEMTEIYEACNLEEATKDHPVAEECVASRRKKNSTSSTEDPRMTSFAPTRRQFASSLVLSAATVFAVSLTRLF